jgi:hypothetical protein
VVIARISYSSGKFKPAQKRRIKNFHCLTGRRTFSEGAGRKKKIAAKSNDLLEIYWTVNEVGQLVLRI